MTSDLRTVLTHELCRLARFGANLADAHSCLIFLPVGFAALGSARSEPANSSSSSSRGSRGGEGPELGSQIGGSRGAYERTSLSQAESTVRQTSEPLARTLDGAKTVTSEVLELMGFHSLSNDILRHAHLPADGGLIGWVARHRRSIHVSPFEHDSRTLGVYHESHELKSFIGVPVIVSVDGQGFTGVICCDSKKSFAFSKLQGKLLEDLAAQISATVGFALRSARGQNQEFQWGTFSRRAEQLREVLGQGAVEAIRIRITNYQQLEEQGGITVAAEMRAQFLRLLLQTLPPHFPVMLHSGGDIVLAVDNMMTSVFEAKARALAKHMASASRDSTMGALELLFTRASRRGKEKSDAGALREKGAFGRKAPPRAYAWVEDLVIETGALMDRQVRELGSSPKSATEPQPRRAGALL